MTEEQGTYTPTMPEDGDLESPASAWRPTAQDDVATWDRYCKALEARIENLEMALQAQPGAEARGIAWMDLFMTKTDPASGRRMIVKMSVTARSDVDATHAQEQLFVAVNHAKQRGFKPYNA